MAAVATATPEPPKGPGVSLFDLVSGFTARTLADGKNEIQRAGANSGRIRLHVEVHMKAGEVEWSTGACSFERRLFHGEG